MAKKPIMKAVLLVTLVTKVLNFETVHRRKGKKLQQTRSIAFRISNYSKTFLSIFFPFSPPVINCTSLTVQVRDPLRMSSCDNNYGAKCTFSCAIGYHLIGSTAVTCIAPRSEHPGVWNNTIPTCKSKLD